MRDILIRWIISALSLLLVGYILPGIEIRSFFYAMIAAAGLGVLNAVVRPILIILTLPLTIFTMGFFILIINALMFWIIGGVFKGIYIESFGSAFLGALILSVVSWLLNSFSIQNGRIGTHELRKGPDGRWS